MMTTAHVAALAIASVVAAGFLWDFWFWICGDPGNTLTDMLRRWAAAQPAIAFAFGFLAGHLFWSR